MKKKKDCPIKNKEKMDGYAEADKINKQIEELLAQHPIVEENAKAWIVFARTIISTLALIKCDAGEKAYERLMGEKEGKKIRRVYKRLMAENI